MSNSGWNRPSSTRPPAPKKPSAMRGVVAGLVVVILALAGAWYFVGGDSFVSERQGKDCGLVKEATPAKARKQVEKPKRRTVVKTGDKVKDALAAVESQGDLVKIDAPVAKKKLKDDKAGQIPFNSGVEQLMCWVFARELGDSPVIVPSISEEEKAKMAEILISKMEIKEGDSERTIAIKETIDYAKKEMAKFIGDGGEPDEFFRYYIEQQKVAFETREDAQQEYYALADEDRELAAEYGKKVNDYLTSKGIRPIDVDEDEAKESVEGEPSTSDEPVN